MQWAGAATYCRFIEGTAVETGGFGCPFPVSALNSGA
jgi:hypothetical protein